MRNNDRYAMRILAISLIAFSGALFSFKYLKTGYYKDRKQEINQSVDKNSTDNLINSESNAYFTQNSNVESNITTELTSETTSDITTEIYKEAVATEPKESKSLPDKKEMLDNLFKDDPIDDGTGLKALKDIKYDDSYDMFRFERDYTIADDSYFDKSVFIGDSRTVGLCEYGSLKGKTSFLAKESVNVYNVLDKELRYTTPDGESEDAYMEEVLEEGSFRKIYLCLGVNELGIGTTYMYYEKYRELLEMIHEYQPEAIIYIEGIMHVSEYYSRRDSARNNTVIVQRNEAIATLANGWNIFYIDMNPYVCTDNGNLDGSLSGDGIHLKASAYEFWDKSLFENAIVRDAEDYSGQENPVFEEYVQETAEEEEETEESGGEGE